MNPFSLLPPLFVFLIAFYTNGVDCTDSSPPSNSCSLSKTTVRVASSTGNYLTPDQASDDEDGEDDYDSTDEDESSSEAETDGIIDSEDETETDSTPVTGVELDLTSQQSTGYYEYFYDDDSKTYSYTARSMSFKNVKRGCTLKTFDKELPRKLVVGYSEHGDVLLSSYHGDTEEFVFTVLKGPDLSTSPGQTVKPPSVATTTFPVITGPSYPDYLKKIKHVFGGTDAGFSDLKSISNYAFKKGSRCVEVRYGDKALWKYDEAKHGENFPTNVLFDTSTGFVVVESLKIYQYLYICRDERWSLLYCHKSRSITRPIFPTDFKFFSGKDGNYSELEKARYTVEVSTIPGSFTFRFILGTQCSLVKYGEHELWKYDKRLHGDNHLTSLTLNTFLAMVTIQSFGNYCYFYAYDDKWREVDETIRKVEKETWQKALEAQKKAEADLRKAQEAKKKAQEDDLKSRAEATRADAVKRAEQKLKADAEAQRKEDEERRKSRQKITEEKAEAEPKEAEPKEAEPKEAEPKEAEPKEAEPTPTPALPSVDLLDLDVKTTASTSKFKYSKNTSTKIVTFTTVDGCGFKSVAKGTVKVWESEDPCVYATKAVNDEQKVLASEPNITITLSNGKTKRFLNYSGMWVVETFEIELNAATKTSGQHYDCLTLKDQAWYYLPHDGYSFSKVTDGKLTFYEAKSCCENSERVDMTKTDVGHDIVVHVRDNNPEAIPSEAVKVGPGGG